MPKAGVASYGARLTPSDVLFRADDYSTKSVTLLAGQVIKALTPLESDGAGKYKVFSGNVSEAVQVSITGNITSGQTIILAGLTLTASATLKPEDVVAAYKAFVESGTTSGTGYAFTGTLTGYNISFIDTDTMEWTSTTWLTDVTNLANSGSATALQLTNTTGVTSLTTKIVGFNLYDAMGYTEDGVTSKDVQIEVFSEASFWADAITWAADAAQDYIGLVDGVNVKACTTFNTGAAGIIGPNTPITVFNELRRRRLKLVEGTEFDNLGFRNPGEFY